MYFLAIDIGASGGRHMLGTLANGKLELTEIHRFKNGMVEKNGRLCWDVDALFEEILTGMAKCKAIGKLPHSVGIDTWGVDFALLDNDGNTIGDVVAYRDSRTNGMDEVLSEHISEAELYARTGIQKLPFNTIYQFMALKQQNPELLAKADGFLLMPEYFSFLLTGVRRHEYTNATTTGLVNVQSERPAAGRPYIHAQPNWDFDLIGRIGLPRHIFGEIVSPGTGLGRLLPHIRERVGFDCDVVFPCTHDTASAVVSAPTDAKSIYLSSGTWSLMGVELDRPICTEDSRKANITNEGGFGFKYRYLKNIMGLWMIQCIKEELDDKYSFEELCSLARESSSFRVRIDVNDRRFLAPYSMIGAIRAACHETRQPIPDTPGELAFCVYQNLADCYENTMLELAILTGKQYDKICIIGGGSQNKLLNELTAKVCRKTVTAGPVEGTAIGNILVQMIAAGQLKDIAEAKRLVRDSFEIETYLVKC